MVYVAELDENGKVKAVSELIEMPEGDRFVRLNSLDASMLGTHYDGTWVGRKEAPPQSKNQDKPKKHLDRVKS